MNHQTEYNNQSNFFKQILPHQDPLEICQALCLMGLGTVPNDISLKQIRDEIYCQIMKQISNNSDEEKAEHGWILLSLVCSTFCPSSKIKYYVKEFFQTEIDNITIFSKNAMYCQERLAESETKPRENPPCTIELVAARMISKCRIPVISMDQSIKTLTCTPALTAQELSEMMAEKNLIKDSFGFSIFISLGTRFAPVGSGKICVMDAICQAERYARANGIMDCWRLYFRKDLFSPNYLSVRHDLAALNLIFTQICGGVKVGEYDCTTSQDLALLVAHQYCIYHPLTHTSVIMEARIKQLCEQSIPDVSYTKYRKQWHKMIKKTLEALKLEVDTYEGHSLGLPDSSNLRSDLEFWLWQELKREIKKSFDIQQSQTSSLRRILQRPVQCGKS